MKDKIRKAFHASSFRYGTFSIIVTAVVLAIIVGINLVVGQLPSELLNIDISENQLFSVGDTTKELVSALTDEVSIYLIATDDGLDETINQMLEKYDDLSEQVSYSIIDPDTNPAFLTNHELSSSDLSGYSDILVVSDKREKFVSYDDIYEVSYTSYYSYDVYYDGEGAVTSAISYVTTDELPKMYVLQGHSEEAFADTISKLISKNNIEMVDLNLNTAGSVPEDCDVLAIIKPQKDFTEDEVDALENYVAYGGKCVIINYADKQADMPNYCEFLAYYGVEIPSGGCIFETSGYCNERSRWYIYEPLTADHDIVSGFSSNSAIYTNYAQPIYQLDDMRNTLTITPFVTTSEGAWLRTDLSSDRYDEKIDSDVDGPFDIAVTITDSTNEGQGQIVLYSTYSLIDSNFVDTAYGYANADLFISSISYLCSLQTNINIESKTTSMSYNSATSGQLQMSITIFVITIPLVILIAGLAIWIRRRKR
jgi:ABC-2 type transport system permease protein